MRSVARNKPDRYRRGNYSLLLRVKANPRRIKAHVDSNRLKLPADNLALDGISRATVRSCVTLGLLAYTEEAGGDGYAGLEVTPRGEVYMFHYHAQHFGGAAAWAG